MEVLSHPWMMGQMPTEREIVDQFTHRRIAVKEYENKQRMEKKMK